MAHCDNIVTLARATVNCRFCHVCPFFNSREEEFAVLLPFLKEGFDAGDRAVHILDKKHRAERVRRRRLRWRLLTAAQGYHLKLSTICLSRSFQPSATAWGSVFPFADPSWRQMAASYEPTPIRVEGRSFVSLWRPSR